MFYIQWQYPICLNGNQYFNVSNINNFISIFQEPEFTLLLSGSSSVVTELTVWPSGRWESSSTTWSAETFPLSQMTRLKELSWSGDQSWGYLMKWKISSLVVWLSVKKTESSWMRSWLIPGWQDHFHRQYPSLGVLGASIVVDTVTAKVYQLFNTKGPLVRPPAPPLLIPAFVWCPVQPDAAVK